jgi:hypothetical protein
MGQYGHPRVGWLPALRSARRSSLTTRLRQRSKRGRCMPFAHAPPQLAIAASGGLSQSQTCSRQASLLLYQRSRRPAKQSTRLRRDDLRPLHPSLCAFPKSDSTTPAPLDQPSPCTIYIAALHGAGDEPLGIWNKFFCWTKKWSSSPYFFGAKVRWSVEM